MDKDTLTPTRDEVRLELQARLLADALRLGTLYGPEKVARLVNKKAPTVTLVSPSINGYPGDLTLADFDIDKLQVGQLAMAMYEYAFEFRHPVGMLPDVFKDEIDAIEDFAFEFRSETFQQFLQNKYHTGSAGDAEWMAVPALCSHTKARLSLDLGESLTIKDLALLARMTERAVRNAINAHGEQKLQVTEYAIGKHVLESASNTEARRWLAGRRGFVATTFHEVSETPGEHPAGIASLLELGQYLNTRWFGLKKTPELIVKELDWDKSRVDYIKNIIAEPHNIDPRDCESLAKSLLVESPWFTEQVMRLLFPRQMDLIFPSGMNNSKLPIGEDIISATSIVEAASQLGRENVSTRLMCVLHDGTKLFPVRMKNRKTSVIAFRLSSGGKGGNTLDEGEEVESEDRMIDMVVNEGYAVRMASDKSAAKSLYKLHARAIQAAYLDSNLLA